MKICNIYILFYKGRKAGYFFSPFPAPFTPKQIGIVSQVCLSPEKSDLQMAFS